VEAAGGQIRLAPQPEMAIEEGTQLSSAPGRAGPSSDASGSGSEESEAGGSAGPLKLKTVNVYNAAITELYHYHVPMGLNKNPNLSESDTQGPYEGPSTYAG
jgi:hypothetical protein